MLLLFQIMCICIGCQTVLVVVFHSLVLDKRFVRSCESQKNANYFICSLLSFPFAILIHIDHMAWPKTKQKLNTLNIEMCAHID